MSKRRNPDTPSTDNQQSRLHQRQTNTADPSAKQVVKKKARVQVPPSFHSRKPEGAGYTYNIWYGRWQGGDFQKSYAPQTPAESRCHPKVDTGITRGSEFGKNAYFCLNFARGCCSKGFECNYLHRIPTKADEKWLDRLKDCFGRDKFRTDRGDMGGVGSYDRDARTLYVGRVGNYDKDVEGVVTRHFAEFGAVEFVRVLHDRNVAFVRYISRYSAEFAREAMFAQSLDNNEILNVRWATEDPNPRAIAENQAYAEAMAAEMLLNDEDQPVGLQYDAEQLEHAVAHGMPVTETTQKALPSVASTTTADFSGMSAEAYREWYEKYMSDPEMQRQYAEWYAAYYAQAGADASSHQAQAVSYEGTPAEQSSSAPSTTQAQQAGAKNGTSETATVKSSILSSATLNMLQHQKSEPKNVSETSTGLVAYGSDSE